MGLRPRLQSITSRLVAVFLAAFVPLAVLQYVINRSYCKQADILAARAQAAQTRAAATSVEFLVDELVNSLYKALGQIQRSDNPEQVSNLLQSIVSDNHECLAAGLIDTENNKYYRYPELQPGQQKEELPPSSLRSDESVTSVYNLAGRNVFTISLPVSFDHGGTGTIYAVVSADAIGQVLSSVMDGNRSAVIIDRNGKLVCKSGNNLSKSSTAALEKASMLVPGRIVELRNASDYSTATILPDFGWRVAVISTAGVPGPSFAREGWYLLWLVLVLPAIAIYYGIGNRIISSIRKLSHAVEAVTVGDLRRRVDVNTRDELQTLAESFNQMTESLEMQQRALRFTTRIQQSLLEVSRTITASLDISRVAASIAEVLKLQFGAVYVVIFRLDDTTGALEPVVSPKINTDSVVAAMLPLAEHALDSPRSLEVPATIAYPNIDLEGLTAVMLPLVVGNRPVGVLAAVFPTDQAGDLALHEQIEFLGAFASTAAIAVHNAYTHSRTSELIKVMDSLRKVDESISASLDLKQVLRSLVRATCEVMEVDACAIFLADKDGRMKIAEAYNLSKEFCEKVIIQPGERWSGVVYQEKRPVHRTDISSEMDIRLHELVKREQLRGLISAPLIVGEEAIGTITVWTRQPHNYKPIEIDLLASIASHAAVVIANAKLFHREYKIAETLQSTLIGVIPDRLGRLVFGHKYIPALDEARVGGDLYDVITLPNKKVALVVADITGKGIQAAVHTAMVRYMIRAFFFQWPDSPAAVLDLLNRALMTYFESKAVVTVFCAVIDPDTGWMTYANAGHPPAIALTRGGRQQIMFYRTGIPVGYSEDSEYDERELMLNPGDMLLLYTDGIIDAKQAGNMLSIEGLQDIVFKYARVGPREMVEKVIEETTNFANQEIRDDIAIIAAALEPSAVHNSLTRTS